MSESKQEDVRSELKRAILLGDEVRASRLLRQAAESGQLTRTEIAAVQSALDQQRFGVTTPAGDPQLIAVLRKLG